MCLIGIGGLGIGLVRGCSLFRICFVCVVRVDGERVFKRVDKNEYRELKQSA